MLHLMIGTDWIKVRDTILDKLAYDVKAGREKRILLVPELISHDTERRLCACAGDTASRYAEVLSFTRMAERVADQCGRGSLQCLDNGGRLVAMAAAARMLVGQLKAYASVETKPEFLTGLVDAVDEFKRCCITPEDLEGASVQAEGSFAQKLHELSLLMQAYDSLCARGKRDPRDKETLLLEQLEDCDFAAGRVFYIDGFPDFTRQHLEILEHLIRVSPSVTVGVNCDCVASGKLAFEKAGNTASILIGLAKKAGVAYDVTLLPDREDALSPVRRGLYQGDLTQQTQALEVWRAQTEFEEVSFCAEKILSLLRGGSRYRDIGIVCADLARYQPLLDLVFHRCGIAMYRAGTEEILRETVITTVLSALEAALGGFEATEVLRYLRSVLSPLDQDTCDEVENYAILWSIRGKAWCADWDQHPGGMGLLWSDADREKLDMLNRARAVAMEPLIRLRYGFERSKNLGAQVKALYAFLEDIDLARHLRILADEMDAQNNGASAQVLNQLWEILIGALEQLYDILGETVWEPEAFLRLFTLLLGQYDVGTIPPVLDAVHIGPVSAMRCTQVQHLIVLGAAEGALPGYGGSAGVLTDQERTALRALGVPLTGGAMEGIQAEFAEIYGVFCGATKSICVTCPAGQPSFVFKRLAQMAGGERKMDEVLGSAVWDAGEAAAYLARSDAFEAAAELGLQKQYRDAKMLAEFELGSISREQITALYGGKLMLSASQVDTQAQCRMAYFLKYGLRAKERKPAQVDPAEFGTYVHAVLEKTAARVMELGGFETVSLEETMALAMEYSASYAGQRFAGVESVRIHYLFERNRRELEMVVQELWEELRSSKFRPEEFELKFGSDGKKPAIEIDGRLMSGSLRGFVDRVDVWCEQGRHYFRVVDYKTGKKDFDYCDVFNGIGLQMLLYLYALEYSGLGSSAGVQYFPARAPLISADGRLGERELADKRGKQWRRNGLLLADEQVLDAMDPEDWGRLCVQRKADGSLKGDFADREQFALLRRYVFSVLGSIVDQIASGDVTANPYKRGSSFDSCAYCPYSQICHKESVSGVRNYKTLSAEKFWEDVGKEVASRG